MSQQKSVAAFHPAVMLAVAALFLAAYSIEVLAQPHGFVARLLTLVTWLAWAVFTADYAKKRYAVLEWQDAELLVPPTELSEGQRLMDPINRQRILRKKQILVDTLASMGIMYRDIQESTMLME